ncbi:hypothetical protein ACS0TY_000397 [Phlomoides rotata]
MCTCCFLEQQHSLDLEYSFCNIFLKHFIFPLLLSDLPSWLLMMKFSLYLVMNFDCFIPMMQLNLHDSLLAMFGSLHTQ